MSELFSSTPPTEPGWYYIKSFGDDIPEVHEIVRMNTGELYLFAGGLDGPDSESFAINTPLTYHRRKSCVEYGPRIPSPEDLATFTPSIDVDIASVRSTTTWIDQQEYEAEMKRLIESEVIDKNGLTNE